MKQDRHSKPAGMRTVVDHPDFIDFLVANERAKLYTVKPRPISSKLGPTYPHLKGS